MSRKYRLSTALDVDDLLMECTSYAIRLANEKYHFDPPMTIYEKDRWGKLGTRADSIYPYFNDPEFYRTQPVYEGAKEFVRRLSQMTEVYICTAVPPEYMGIRAQRILEEFPEIPRNHIYMGYSKDKIKTDILFDDAMHNILNSGARYPILMRRPWNQEATGMLAVNNYDEFLKLVEVIAGANTSAELVQKIKDLSVQLGKTPVEVNEAPGFVVNRILIPMINEAVGLVEAGVASVEDIDIAMKLGANHPMGPLELGDLIGLDVCLSIMAVLYEETHDSKYRAYGLLRKMVRSGKLGRKTKVGFYDYNK